MSIKRMNFTSRRRLTRDQANVVIHPAPDASVPATFDVELDLSTLRPAADAARVFVEAYHQTTRMRFDFGTVGAIVKPPMNKLRLQEFSEWRDIRFRVKITGVNHDHGRILAWADRIKPRGPEDQDELDLVRFRDADLYGLLWDMDYDDEGPIVQIERNAGGAQRVGRSDHFIAAVYPEVLRRALEKALLEEQMSHDDPEHWFQRWYAGYLKAKLGMNPPPPPDQQEPRREWIKNAVHAFGGRFQIVHHWPAEDAQQAGGKP
jgi:hypothetical protein